MICLDSDAAIAAFQKDPPENIAHLRERVLYFLRSHNGMRVMFPTVALSEYVWRADLAELQEAILRAVGGSMFTPGFNHNTATVAAELGRKYSQSNKLGHVAKVVHYDRVALKADLLIVAIAKQHQPKFFLTRDADCHAIAIFAGLESRLIGNLPEPPPLPPPSPPKPTPPTYRQPTIMEVLEGADEENPEGEKSEGT